MPPPPRQRKGRHTAQLDERIKPLPLPIPIFLPPSGQLTQCSRWGIRDFKGKLCGQRAVAMTLLVGWAGVDTHGVASAYIAADSRVTWRHARFDHGRKVYGLQRSGDILGYCGDVLFPALVLGQVSEMADAGLLFERDAAPDQKAKRIVQKLQEQFARYPADVAGIAQDVIQVLHVSRTAESPGAFSAYQNQWRRGSAWSQCNLPLPGRSGLIVALGSGQASFSKRFEQYSRSAIGGTSRAVFLAFCRTVTSGEDPQTGGAPQLVGLYRGGPAESQKYGIIFQGQRYIFGASVEDTVAAGGVEWRNELFEICEGQTKQRIAGAQRQPDPVRD